jgi:AcrR family transcriptional regulator
MAYPDYIREKARRMRSERRMSLTEIAERLSIPKTTVWYWIKDIEIPGPLPSPFMTLRQAAARKTGNEAMCAKYKAQRDAAYREGRDEFQDLIREPTFRDFLCLYLAEGYKRNRNTVAIANSDPSVLRVADHWIRRFSRRKILYSVQYHADQDPDQLRQFWASDLGFDPADFRYQRKSNSNQLKKRTWRSKWGVLTITTNDTMLRARLQAWLDLLQEGWVESLSSGA